MANKTKKISITIFVFVIALLLITFAGFKTEWKQCKICGMQEYERSFFGIIIESHSERNYDEFGTARKWEEEHGKPCTHEWEVK